MKKLLLFFIPAIIGSNFLTAQTALDFDGVDDYVVVPYNSAWKLTSDKTISFWMKTSNTSYQYVMGTYDGGTRNWDLIIGSDGCQGSTGKLYWFIAGCSGGPTSTTTVTDNNWHHISVTYKASSGAASIYVDGTLENTGSGSGNTNSNSNLHFGNIGPSMLAHYKGIIDDVRIWDTVRTGAEILADMNNCLSGSENGLIALYDFEDGAGSTLTDLTSNGFDGTLTNMDAVNDWVAGKSCIPLCFPIDTSTSITGLTITSNATGGATYRWLDCDNSSAVIPGETNQDFTATANGNYAVEITDSICVDTSACVNISGVGIDQNNFSSTIAVYPNPTNNVVHINLSSHVESINYTLSTIEGRIVHQEQNITDANITIDLNNENKGIYLLKINNANSATVYKVIKQ